MLFHQYYWLQSYSQNIASAKLPPANSLPSGEARVVWFPTPTPCGELMGAISLLFRPGTLSAGGPMSTLFSPAFDRTFDHLQLIGATLIFKLQKDLQNK